MNDKPSFYAIIPATVRYDKRLKPCARLLYGEITALADQKGYCWASNAYFAELYDVDPHTISKWVGQLAKYGYIGIEIIYKTGTKEIANRYIQICPEVLTKRSIPMDKKIHTPMDKKGQDITTEFSITTSKNKYIPFSENSGNEEADGSSGSPNNPEITSRRKKPEKKFYGEFDNVSLSEDEYAKLFSDYGRDQTKAIIEKLSAYKAEKGKVYKSDMAAIRIWVIGSLEIKKLPPPAARCPHCGKPILDGICNNARCPQYEIKEGEQWTLSELITNKRSSEQSLPTTEF